MIYWYEWNKLAEMCTEVRVRVEHDVNSPSLWEYLNLEWKPEAIAGIPTDTNTKLHNSNGAYLEIGKDEFTKMMVDTDAELYGKIMTLAEKYGYEV